MKKLFINQYVAFLLVLMLASGCEWKDNPTSPEKIASERANNLNKTSCLECVEPPSDLVNWWPFDENDGSMAEDIIGGNHGSIFGATHVAGKVAKALNFDGNDDCVTAPDNASLDITSTITIDAWIKLTRIISEQTIVCKQPSGWADANHAGNFEFGIHYAKLSFKSQFAPYNRTTGHTANMPDLVIGEWYFVAVTADATSRMVKFYVNGNLVDSAILPYSIMQYTNDEPLRIGRRKDGLFFNGIIDEVEVFNRILSSEEIKALYNAGSAGKCKFIHVEIDIKPGSYPNSINCQNNNGVIPVAIITTEAFDATNVDHKTVRFGKTGIEAMEMHVDKKTCEPKRHEEDVDGDGDIDLVFHFRFGDTHIECGDEEAILTGVTFGGKNIIGIDSIRAFGD
ncbi:MAG: LamG domain-containing protein [candidate division KSB1 bacterium]|nr:LamG domain-containing protein [candidate division KSB1 bacterium]